MKIVGINPFISKKFSVKVPVLSNTIVFIVPNKFTLSLFMQKISCFFNLYKLYDIPKLKHVGKEGGTAEVNNSKNLRINSS